jgi:hypothetical protein
MITLASAQARLVRLEALREARREQEREQELALALDKLDLQHMMALVVWLFLSRDCCHGDPEEEEEGPPAMDWDDFLVWARGGLLADELPRRVQPAWEQAQELGRRLLAHEDVPDLHGLYEWLTQDEAGTARNWTRLD